MIPRHFVITMVVLLVAVLGLGGYAWHMRKTVAATPVASTDTRARMVGGSTSRRYDSSWASNHSTHGMDTTRADTPSAASCSRASSAIATSLPVPIRMTSSPPAST